MTLSSTFAPSHPLVLVGAGKMGGALLAGWLARGVEPSAVVAIDPSPTPEGASFLKQSRVALHAAPPKGLIARLVVVAVKPQIIAGVLPGLRPLFGEGTVALSIAAGTTLHQLAAGLGPAVAIVRSIPNTPAQVGRGITAAVANRAAGAAERSLATTVLEAVGEVVWVDDEALIDSVTAVSGSGPAYVFLFAECLAAAGRAAGLPAETADRLARATVTGAGELLHRSGETPEQLRKNVTSPNGTTAAALAVLMGEGGLEPLVREAVLAALKRSRELSG